MHMDCEACGRELIGYNIERRAAVCDQNHLICNKCNAIYARSCPFCNDSSLYCDILCCDGQSIRLLIDMRRQFPQKHLSVHETANKESKTLESDDDEMMEDFLLDECLEEEDLDDVEEDKKREKLQMAHLAAEHEVLAQEDVCDEVANDKSRSSDEDENDIDNVVEKSTEQEDEDIAADKLKPLARKYKESVLRMTLKMKKADEKLWEEMCELVEEEEVLEEELDIEKKFNEEMEREIKARKAREKQCDKETCHEVEEKTANGFTSETDEDMDNRVQEEEVEEEEGVIEEEIEEDEEDEIPTVKSLHFSYTSLKNGNAAKKMIATEAQTKKVNFLKAIPSKCTVKPSLQMVEITDNEDDEFDFTDSNEIVKEGCKDKAKYYGTHVNSWQKRKSNLDKHKDGEKLLVWRCVKDGDKFFQSMFIVTAPKGDKRMKILLEKLKLLKGEEIYKKHSSK